MINKGAITLSMLRGQRFGFIIEPTNIHTGKRCDTEEVYYCFDCGKKTKAE
jgi:hypothetical protein